MAAAPQPATVNVIINGIELAVPKGELVVEAVKRLGLEIPIFCYHPRMKPVGMCRMCLVETGMKQPDGTIRMMPKPAAACTLPVSEGLVINTESEALHRDRKGVLEFLLVNHPLDCPICDRGGECPLQNNTLFYGPSTSRFIEMKRHAVKAFPLSDYVTLDLERCIQCARCVRFTEEISGDAQLAFRFRGANTQPVTFGLSKFTSKFSGNVIEICPVGALTNRKYRFRARPWDLQTAPAICTNCSNGCAIWFDHRAGKLVRINGRINEAVNEEWTCDKGKFGHEHYNDEKRLTSPFMRTRDQLEKADWADATAALLESFRGAGPGAGIALGGQLSNESLYAISQFVTQHAPGVQIAQSVEAHAPLGKPHVHHTIESLESKGSLAVFGSSLADDLPIIYLRIRKASFRHGANIAIAYHEATEVDDFASVVVRYQRGTESEFASALAALAQGGDPAAHLEKCGVSSADAAAYWEIAQHCTLSTTRLYESASGAAAAATLKALHGSNLSLYPRGANEYGAALVEICTTASIQTLLNQAIQGRLQKLWLVGIDPFEIGLDRDYVIRALESVETLVCQLPRRSEAFYYATVALPLTLPAEMDGTYVNAEGRLQRMSQAIPPVGESKSAQRVFEELSVRCAARIPKFGTAEAFGSIPAFQSVRLSDLQDSGTLIR